MLLQPQGKREENWAEQYLTTNSESFSLKKIDERDQSTV